MCNVVFDHLLIALDDVLVMSQDLFFWNWDFTPFYDVEICSSSRLKKMTTDEKKEEELHAKM